MASVENMGMNLPIPVIYGDGIHDDSPGLVSLVNGRQVDNRAGVTFDGEKLYSPAGRTIMTRGAIFKNGSKPPVPIAIVQL